MKNKVSFKHFINHPKGLFWYYIVLNMVPSLYFFFHQATGFFGKCSLLLFPLGIYLLIFSLVKNTGKWQVFLFPLLFLHAFQIVLFYLFGNGVIASDMFLNLLTTNSAEVDELLGALLPSIVIVCCLYIPPLIIGIKEWRKKIYPPLSFRKKTFKAAVAFLFTGFVLSFFAMNDNGSSFTLTENVYPVNALYNMGFALYKNEKINELLLSTKDFSFHAKRKKIDTNRQIIVFVIGETSRADNWGLYGYERETTPRLKKLKNIIFYKDAITQSNVTHKSVPLLLTSIEAANFKDIYKRKGIFSAFKEVGFTTAFLSNQLESSFIEFFGKEADIYQIIRSADSENTNYDGRLISLMKKTIAENSGDLLIVLHTYGSHFNYTDRYPKRFRKYIPDSITNVSTSQKTEMVNAYDNSILYTDYFLSKTIEVLKDTKASTTLLYTSDHGEDIFDDEREKFLHSSPYPTYYQLHIPMLLWFSKEYELAHPQRYLSAKNNVLKPISTNSVFPTLLDLANIKSPYANTYLSLTNPNFKETTRMYLNDHDKAIPFQKMNLEKEDFIMMKKNHIKY